MMITQAVRLALAAAMLWIGFGVGGRAEAGGIALSTPAGLTPGETFRFAFVTEGTTAATSTDINYYNSFVNAQAEGATYDGKVVSWVAIASTPTVNAIDNVGQTLTPVYLAANGVLVTTSTTASGLWSGSLLNPISDPFTSPFPGTFDVWTGTLNTGVPFPGAWLGSQLPIIGESFVNDINWVYLETGPANTTQFSMYGISQVLVVAGAVPEPSTRLMAGIAIFAGSAFGWSRRRRDQRRQWPVGPPDAT
jgi:hypothetical protein